MGGATEPTHDRDAPAPEPAPPTTPVAPPAPEKVVLALATPSPVGAVASARRVRFALADQPSGDSKSAPSPVTPASAPNVTRSPARANGMRIAAAVVRGTGPSQSTSRGVQQMIAAAKRLVFSPAASPAVAAPAAVAPAAVAPAAVAPAAVAPAAVAPAAVAPAAAAPVVVRVRRQPIATVGNGVSVRRSLIPHPDANNGLFADRPFAAGAIITEYAGQILGREEAAKLKDKTYLRGLSSQHFVLDGLREPFHGAGGASFANHSAPRGANAVFHRQISDYAGLPRGGIFASTERVFLKAKRHIAANEEITVWYGKHFWVRGAEQSDDSDTEPAAATATATATAATATATRYPRRRSRTRS